MSNLTVMKDANFPAPMPPEVMAVNSAMEAFQTALQVGVEIYAKAEDAKTQRALITAQKEIAALTVEAETQKAMHSEELLHERRMKVLQIIEDLLMSHAENLTPGILSAAQLMINCLQELD